jgi:hypothetical protein
MSAATQARGQLHHLAISPNEAHLFRRLSNAVLYRSYRFRHARILAHSAAPGESPISFTELAMLSKNEMELQGEHHFPGGPTGRSH